MTSNSPEHDESTGSGAGRSSLSDARSAGGAGPIPSGTPSGTPSGDRERVAPAEPSPSPRGKAATAGGKGRKPGTSASGGDWNVFRTVVVLVGVVIAGFGAYYLILGTAGLPETEASPANPTLESQFRFFSAMMVGVGAAFITIAVKFQWANMLWLVCLMVFVGGIGRVLSWAFSGTPHYVMIVLMVVELAFPPALLVWHKYIAKTSDLRREFAQRG
ncbi:DUF4345 domain-containing protein [Arthrobacter sedimenti]|uniref:DUF4345 domain-containing protein n=1 Tax=Arthrobacter sedimenti TaxID=2694931 RepID=UPI00142066CF|nr:DUF4345 domain-containing protein [Arthrobacter sedimenti]